MRHRHHCFKCCLLHIDSTTVRFSTKPSPAGDNLQSHTTQLPKNALSTSSFTPTPPTVEAIEFDRCNDVHTKTPKWPNGTLNWQKETSWTLWDGRNFGYTPATPSFSRVFPHLRWKAWRNTRLFPELPGKVYVAMMALFMVESALWKHVPMWLMNGFFVHTGWNVLKSCL